MNNTQKLMLGVDALRRVYPDFKISCFSKKEILDEFRENAEIVLEHDSPTVSETEGMKIPQILMSDKGINIVDQDERDAPYGCISKEDMLRAIEEGDLEIIEESPVLANVTLGEILREDPDLERSLDSFIRNHRGEEIPFLLDEWSDIPETKWDLDALVMIQEQRSQSPKRNTRQAQKAMKIAFLKMLTA